MFLLGQGRPGGYTLSANTAPLGHVCAGGDNAASSPYLVLNSGLIIRFGEEMTPAVFVLRVEQV